MRFSTAIFATVVAFGASAMATGVSRPSFNEIIARHENDLVLEARGEMTEFEARALLVARAPPNGDCNTASPQRMNARDCYNHHGVGWKIHGYCFGHQQMLLQGTQEKGTCYF